MLLNECGGETAGDTFHREIDVESSLSPRRFPLAEEQVRVVAVSSAYEWRFYHWPARINSGRARKPHGGINVTNLLKQCDIVY